MPRRARTLAELKDVLGKFATQDGFERGLAFRPRQSDVLISPFAKCGTTWMQQIVHGLRSGGDMSFGEISEVVPWIELADDMGIDLEAPQTGPFRAFKSHLGWDMIPKGARYIVVLRDPIDAMVSLYRFFDGWFMERGAVPMDPFADYFLNRAPERNYWTHMTSWWAARDRNDVLLLAYEHMKQDLPGAVGQVADFLSINDQALRDLATRQATLEFMRSHGRQFDDHPTRDARDPACGLPPGSEATKVDSGQAGSGKPAVSESVRHAFDQKWQDTIGADHGLTSYDAMIKALEP